MKNLKNKNGITLIALVITIIVMLILAAVSITMAVNGGLFGYAQNASQETEEAKVQEQKLASGIIGGQRIEDLISGGTSLLPGETIPAGGVYLRMSSDFTTQKGSAYYSSITAVEEAIIKGLLIEFLDAPATVEIEDMFTKVGEFPPESIQTMDIYIYGDYIYTYDFAGYKVDNNFLLCEGWTAQAYDKTKSSYGELLNSINGEELGNMIITFYNCTELTVAPKIPNTVTIMGGTFLGCRSLTIAPTIPNGVTNMDSTFLGCESLITPPTIPNGVTNMNNTFCNCVSLISAPYLPSTVTNLESAFENCPSLRTVPTIPNNVVNMCWTFGACTSLTTIPTIPQNVTNLYSTFFGCTSLTGTITINANPTEYGNCFYGTTQPIYLTGTSTMLADLADTSETNPNNVTY